MTKERTFLLTLLVLITLFSILIAARDVVNIRIITDPPGASIYFNNTYVGISDSGGVKILESIPCSKHLIRIEKSGYKGIDKKINVDLLNVSFNFKLLKKLEKSIDITIKCNVPEAVVFLDQNRIGTTNFNGIILIPGVFKGSHSIKIEKEGFFPLSENFDVSDGNNNFEFNLALKNEITIRTSTGKRLVLTCNETGAFIFIDNILQNERTIDGEIIFVLAPGNHELRVEKNGWETEKKVITLSGKLDLKIDFVLNKAIPIPSISNDASGKNYPVIIITGIFLFASISVLFMIVYFIRSSKKRLGVIGKFELLQQIGKGGIATVYKAKDTIEKKIVALKVMDDASLRDPDLVYRFFIEGEIISKINKEFPEAPVVRVYEYGRDKEKSLGIPFISMEFLKGKSLLSLIKNKEVGPIEHKMFIIKQVAHALKAAHSLGIVHGDITPDNIFILNGDRVVLIDFGVALQTHDSYKNMDASITGKPLYMAPEHISGSSVDGKSDIYSLGVILFMMITGVPPFQAGNPHDVVRMHQENPVPQIQINIDEEIKNLVFKLLEKDPQKRPSSSELEMILNNLKF